MRRRLLATYLKKELQDYPAVAILGPRQCGKTTLAKTLGRFYFDLEQETDQLRLDLEWEQLIRQNKRLVLDEAQAHPKIFPKLRGAIDAEPQKKGRFLLLGSVAPALMTNVAESLAGRLALCELSPFSVLELPAHKIEHLWAYGGFPQGGVLTAKRFPDWQKNYLSLLAQRDLPIWGLSSTPNVTARFFKMTAACHGQIWNASTVGASLGLSYHTVNRYLDFLKNAFLVLVLPPYFENMGKRLIKSPKIYWKDTGLLHALLGMSSKSQLLNQPWAGASWEGFCVNQILSSLKAVGKPFEAHFFRTSDGHEIDLLLVAGKRRLAIEFKLTASPAPTDFTKLERAGNLVRADGYWLISKVTKTSKNDKFLSTNLREAVQRLME